MIRWSHSIFLKLGAVFALASIAAVAEAGSRFETSPSASPKAAVHLDFVILVPEMVYLGPNVNGTGNNSVRSLASGNPADLTSRLPYAILTNAGTLALGSGSVASGKFETKARPPEGSSIRVYVVAIP